MIFNSRKDAGRALAERLEHLQGENIVVLGLPRGGVPVAREVSERIHAPLDVIVVRKLGVPTQPELAMGAVGEGGVVVTNEEALQMIQITPEEFARVREREEEEVKARADKFRHGRKPIPLKERIALIIDDGMATGSTALAACKVARAMGARKVILAVPVGSREAIIALEREADEVISLVVPNYFSAVGEWYRDFTSVSDQEVVRLLNQNNESQDEEIRIEIGSHLLSGHLTVPENAKGIVIFAHGSGSSHKSPRNQSVARSLNEIGLATLLFDLLDSKEESDRKNVFDIDLLTERLSGATQWVGEQPGMGSLPRMLFGASTGAAAALQTATDPTLEIKAVVSRGGRPDLAGQYLSKVDVPTLFIVGGEDNEVIRLNRQAQSQLKCENRLEVVPGATHLFEEPGALDQVADLAGKWFLKNLPLP